MGYRLSAQRLALSCVVLRERSDRGPRQLQRPSYTAICSRSRFEIFPDNTRMLCRNPEKGQCWSLRSTSPLLPVSQGMNADPHRFGELLLGQTNKASEGRDVLATFKLTLDQPFAQTCGNGAGKILFSELGHFVCHA